MITVGTMTGTGTSAVTTVIMTAMIVTGTMIADEF
jgi:hypothetical protein